MESKEIDTFYPSNRAEWRQWLEENHNSKQSIWVICYKKETNIPTISWSEAVDEALCFGWIDSTRRSLDSQSFIQYFGKRKPKGTWSKINKEKIKKLLDQGLMAQAGLDSIENAKQNGSWTILDEVEELIIPKDLENELNSHPEAMDLFLGLSRSVRKLILFKIVLAKRPETRQKRITEIVEQVAKNQKPKLFWES